MGRFREQRLHLRGLVKLHLAWRSRPAIPEVSTGQIERQQQCRLSATEVDDLVAAYRDGATYQDLMMRFGVGETTVWAHLRRRGVPKRGSWRLSDKELIRLAQRYAAGATLSSLASEFGVSYRKVRAALLEQEVELRPRGRMVGSPWSTARGDAP